MPSRRFHQAWARKQGYSGEVDDFIDGPWAFLGNRHRILHHTFEEAFWIGYMIDGMRGAMGGLAHVWFDRAASADKNFGAFLEMWAEQQSSRKKGGIMLTYEVKKARAWIIQNGDIEPTQKVKKARAWIIQDPCPKTSQDAATIMQMPSIRYRRVLEDSEDAY